MSKKQPNRLQFDADSEPESTATNNWVYDSPPDDTPNNDPVYLEEPDPAIRQRIRLKIFIWSGITLLALLLIGGVLSYFYWDVLFPPPEKPVVTETIQQDLERLRDEFFLPAEPLSDALKTAIALYETNHRERARIEFENFVNGSAAPDREKAAALNYLGVMALEASRPRAAKNHLLRALRYNDESLYVLGNLALVEQQLGNPVEARQYARMARNAAPKNLLVTKLLGGLLTEIQDLPGAIDTYKEGLETDPADPQLLYNLAVVLLKKENHEEAILNFSKAIEKAGPGRIAVLSHAHLGQIYFTRGAYAIATDHLRKAALLAPDNARYRYNLGVAYLQQQKQREAIEEFKKALTAGKSEPAVYSGLAEAFIGLKQPGLAIEALRRALYAHPNNIPVMLQLGDLYYQEKDLLNAADTFRKVVNLTPGNAYTAEALLKLGSIYVEMERFNEAADAIKGAITINPNNAQARYRLGLAYQKAARPDMAAEAWRKSFDQTTPMERADERLLRLALARLYRMQGAPDLALQEFRLALARNNEAPAITEDPEIQLELGKTYLQLKDYGNAIVALQSAAASGSATVSQRKAAYLNLAVTQQKTGLPADLEKARNNIHKAVRLDPSDQRNRMVQAGILLRTNSLLDREKAIEILQMVTHSDVGADLASEAYNLLGLSYYKNGEYSRSLKAFDYAIQLNPANKEAYENQRAAINAYENSL